MLTWFCNLWWPHNIIGRFFPRFEYLLDHQWVDGDPSDPLKKLRFCRICCRDTPYIQKLKEEGKL